jgi:uncharacterized membrane protein YedE/YeeE
MNMISILKIIQISFLRGFILLGLFSLSFGFALAQSPTPTLTLSISPSLFDMSVNPGQEWRSSLKVINVNDYDLTVYVEVVNFLPQGETGDGRFVPINANETGGTTLAEWFIINKEPIIIPREQTFEIPIAVRVPVDAAPGGHFAAILVGTKPLDNEAGEARVQTSQMITSLFFARVAGDIKEMGLVREFTAESTWLSKPEATFNLRFENKGNVHLQPQGDIRITNMWGQERGVIPINQSTQFGNVLPESIRKFTFAWKGEWSVSDIGRYTAEVTLAYGTTERQFTNAKASFWVIPVKLLLGIVIGLGLFAALVTWLVRLYVSRMLAMAGIDVNEYHSAVHHNTLPKRRVTKSTIHRPFTVSFGKWIGSLKSEKTLSAKLARLVEPVLSNRLVFVGILIVIVCIGLAVRFVLSANTEHRGYEIEYVNADANLKLTSEEIIYNQFKRERVTSDVPTDTNLPALKIVNRSGIPGLGAEARLRLETRGYKINELSADFSSPQKRTVVVYAAELEREALRLSARLGNAPASKMTEEQAKEGSLLIVYVGNDISAIE